MVKRVGMSYCNAIRSLAGEFLRSKLQLGLGQVGAETKRHLQGLAAGVEPEAL